MERVEAVSHHLAANLTAAAADKLVGRCSCGSVSWEGRGDPAVTFYCHCSLWYVAGARWGLALMLM